MSEPITLYRGNETITVHAPSEALRLVIREGWTHEQGQAGQGQAQGKEEGWQEGRQEVAVTLELDDGVTLVAKRGRAKKAQ